MRSMVERETPMAAEVGANPDNNGSSLSDPAPPGHLSLRERGVFLKRMQASAPDGAGQSTGLARGATVRGGAPSASWGARAPHLNNC